MSYFKKLNTQHLHTTYSAINQSAFVPIVNTEIHGIASIKHRSVETWNKLQKTLPDNLPNLTRTKTKQQITTTLRKSYSSPYYNQKNTTLYWFKAGYLKFSLFLIFSRIFLLLLSTHGLLLVSLIRHINLTFLQTNQISNKTLLYLEQKC